MIEVQNKLSAFVVDDTERDGLDEIEVLVKSHWDRPRLVVLVVGDRKLVVEAADLKTAIDNATNTGRS